MRDEFTKYNKRSHTNVRFVVYFIQKVKYYCNWTLSLKPGMRPTMILLRIALVKIKSCPKCPDRDQHPRIGYIKILKNNWFWLWTLDWTWSVAGISSNLYPDMNYEMLPWLIETSIYLNLKIILNYNKPKENLYKKKKYHANPDTRAGARHKDPVAKQLAFVNKRERDRIYSFSVLVRDEYRTYAHRW